MDHRRRHARPPARPRIYVWQATGPGELPGTLAELLTGHDVTPVTVSPDLGQEWARGWQGDHPFTTSYAHSFAQPLEADGRVARIPVPGIDGAQDSGVPRGDIIAVQVEISATSGVRPDWTFSVLNKRSYAPVLREYDGVMHGFVRPVAEGRVLSVSSGAREVLISAVPSSTILGKLIEAPVWSARQTPGGVFVTRFIERLGGPGSTVANQPGARAALLEVTRSERGRPTGAIVQSIKRWQGSWPESLAGDADGYPAAVFQFLLRQAILRAVLPVDCPYCTSGIAFRPEDLATQMKCEMCLREFPLGLALGMKANGRNDWLYEIEDETSVLRDFAQRPPRTLPDDSAIEPVLPIALTERNLSATRFDQHHPSSWSPADGVVGLAKESCQRNLGMTGLEPAEDVEGFYFRPQWQPPSPAAASDRR